MAKRYKKANEYDTKADRSRAEREKRLEAIKKKDGSSKPVVKKRNAGKIVLSVLGIILLVLILLCIIGWQTGFIQREFTAMRVGDIDVSINEYDYAYNNISNIYNRYYGKGGLLDLKADSSSVTKKDMTWGEFFKDTAKTSVKNSNLLYREARRAGYDVNDADKQEVDKYIADFQKGIGSPVDFELYLKNTYGKGMTVDAFKEIMLKQQVANRFANEKPASFEVSEEEISQKYEENKDDYDMVSYQSFLVKTNTVNEKGDKLEADDLSKAREKSKAKAEEILAQVNDESDLPELAEKEVKKAQKEKSKEDSSKAETETNVNRDVLYSNVKKAAIRTEEKSKWLFDPDRKKGDKTYIESGDDYEVLYFISRDIDDRNTADIRVASYNLYDPEGKKKSAEAIDKIRKSAKRFEVLAKDDASFVKLEKEEKEKSEQSRINDSTKYESVNGSNADQLSSKVLNWALSPEANTGDTKVIETEGIIYVVHVIEKHDAISYVDQITKELQAEKYSDWFDKLSKAEGNQVKEVYPGFSFVKNS